MTQITIKESEKEFSISCKQHCERDICLAVSALMNAIVVFFDNFVPEKMEEKEVKYERGNTGVSVKFKTAEYKREFVSGIKSSLMALEAYQRKFPEQIALSRV